MKKISSLFILGFLFAMNCASSMSLAGFFEGDHKSMNHLMEMEHDSTNMNMSDCCESMEMDCDENMHDCCISPFADSNTPSYSIQETKKKTITIDNYTIDLLGILHGIEEEQIFLQRVTSPPGGKNNNYLALENSYTAMVGVIKNNC